MNKYAPYILFLLITLFVAVLSMNQFGPIESAQRSVNDMMCRFMAEDRVRPNVVLVNIDGVALDEYGPWPWNYELIADLTAATAAGEPKAVLLNLDLPEDGVQEAKGYTDTLATQLQWIDQVVLTYDIALAMFESGRTSNPDFLFKNAVIVDNALGIMKDNSSLLARKVFAPAEKLLEHKPLLGFKYFRPDEDRVLRHQPLLMNYEGYYYPSLELATAATFHGVKPQDITVVEGKSISLGDEYTFSINERSETFVNYSLDMPFAQFSAAEVLSEDFERELFKDKVVIVGPAPSESEFQFDTPVQADTPDLIVRATVIENLVNKNVIADRQDLATINLLILLALGGGFAFVLPRIIVMYRLLTMLGMLIVLANAGFMLFSYYQMLVPTMYIGLELVLFALASPMLDWNLMAFGAAKAPAPPTVKPKRAKAKRATAEVPVKELVSSPSDQDQLDTKAVSSDSGPVQANDQTSASDRDHDHQLLNIDGFANEPDSGGVPLTESGSLEPVEPIQNEVVADSSGVPIDPDGGLTDSDRLAATGMGEDKPFSDSANTPTPLQPTELKNLGRYQITGVLGKGAMGMVYKGVDPAINRPVAMKTIRLDFVSDPEEMAELKERLHREAQAAGKLSHPNIVTIYDVGSEGSLQYIAMEYLEGQTLEEMIKRKVRFNYRIIAQIISQICSALGYAHERGIVHRDIKPANIMVLGDYRVKVMDYGIARVDSHSMTKTGVAMGTPNYISPEQLKGLEIDSRADIFSLGVVMYEMLLGKRPFKGENLTSLMYAIMNHEPEKPSNVRPQIPLLFDHIIGRALKKSPAERYQKASEVSADLQDFVESFAH